MTTVTVFRHAAAADRSACAAWSPIGTFEALEQNLDWLETIGVLVERIDPLGTTRGNRALPSCGGVAGSRW